ncbi:hypothetical protein ACOMHN_009369 [Nucella lapillus]
MIWNVWRPLEGGTGGTGVMAHIFARSWGWGCLIVLLTAASVPVADSYSSTGGDTSCQGSDFSPDSDCTHFWRCANGKAFKFTCPAGLHFNPHINVCDWPKSAGCTGNRGTGSYYSSSDYDDSYEHDYSRHDGDKDTYYPYQPPTSPPGVDKGSYQGGSQKTSWKAGGQIHTYIGEGGGGGGGRGGGGGDSGSRDYDRGGSYDYQDSGGDSHDSGGYSHESGGHGRDTGGHGHETGGYSSHDTGGGYGRDSGGYSHDSGEDYSAEHGSSSGGGTGGGGGRGGGGGGGGGHGTRGHSGGQGYRHYKGLQSNLGPSEGWQRTHQNTYSGGPDPHHHPHHSHGHAENFGTAPGGHFGKPGGGYQGNSGGGYHGKPGGDYQGNSGGGYYGKPGGGYQGNSGGGYYGKAGGGYHRNAWTGYYGKPGGGYPGKPGGGYPGGYNYGGLSFNQQPVPWVAQPDKPSFTAGLGGGSGLQGKQPYAGHVLYGKQPFYQQYQPPLTPPRVAGDVFPQPLPPKPFIGPHPAVVGPSGPYSVGHLDGPGPVMGQLMMQPGPYPMQQHPRPNEGLVREVFVGKPPPFIQNNNNNNNNNLPGPVAIVKEVTWGRPNVNVSSLGRAFIPVMQKNPQLSALLLGGGGGGGGGGRNYLQFNPLAQGQSQGQGQGQVMQLNDGRWVVGLSGLGGGGGGMTVQGGGGMMGGGMSGMSHPGGLSGLSGGLGWMAGSGMNGGNVMMQPDGSSLSKILVPVNFLSHTTTTTASTTTPTTAPTGPTTTTPTPTAAPVNVIILNPFLPATLPLPNLPITTSTTVTDVPLPRTGDVSAGAARALLTNVLQTNRNPALPVSIATGNGFDTLQFSSNPATRCRTTPSPQRVTLPILQQSGAALTERKCSALGQLLNSFVQVYLENLGSQTGATCLLQVPRVQVLCNTGPAANTNGDDFEGLKTMLKVNCSCVVCSTVRGHTGSFGVVRDVCD